MSRGAQAAHAASSNPPSPHHGTRGAAGPVDLLGVAPGRPEPTLRCTHTQTHADPPGEDQPRWPFLSGGPPARQQAHPWAFRPLPSLGRLPGSCAGPARAAISSRGPGGSLPLLGVCKWPVPGTACPSEEPVPCRARSQSAASPAKGPSFTSREPGGRPGLGTMTHHGGTVQRLAGVPGGGPRAPWLTEKPRRVPASRRHGASKGQPTSGNHRHTKRSTGPCMCARALHAYDTRVHGVAGTGHACAHTCYVHRTPCACVLHTGHVQARGLHGRTRVRTCVTCTGHVCVCYLHTPRCAHAGKGLRSPPDHCGDLQNEHGLWRTAGLGRTPSQSSPAS